MRAASWNRDPQIPDRRITIGGSFSLAAIHGGCPLASRGEASRFDADSCGSPGTVRSSANGEKIQRERDPLTKQKVDEGPSDWLLFPLPPAFVSRPLSVLTRATWTTNGTDERHIFLPRDRRAVSSSLSFGNARSWRVYADAFGDARLREAHARTSAH